MTISMQLNEQFCLILSLKFTGKPWKSKKSFLSGHKWEGVNTKVTQNFRSLVINYMTAHDHYYAIKWTILFNTILGQACDAPASPTGFARLCQRAGGCAPPSVVGQYYDDLSLPLPPPLSHAHAIIDWCSSAPGSDLVVHGAQNRRLHCCCLIVVFPPTPPHLIVVHQARLHGIEAALAAASPHHPRSPYFFRNHRNLTRWSVPWPWGLIERAEYHPHPRQTLHHHVETLGH